MQEAGVTEFIEIGQESIVWLSEKKLINQQNLFIMLKVWRETALLEK